MVALVNEIRWRAYFRGFAINVQRVRTVVEWV